MERHYNLSYGRIDTENEGIKKLPWPEVAIGFQKTSRQKLIGTMKSRLS